MLLAGQAIRLLHVEDSIDDHFLLQRHFHRAEVAVEWRRVDNAADFLDALGLEGSWDAILCDHHLPGFESSHALSIAQERGIDFPFLLVSGAIGEMGVLAAMKAGAHDYIPKNDLFRLVPALQRELREAEIRREKRWADERLRESNEELRNAVETLTHTQNHLARVERLRAMGQIASGVAHDFNNGLTKILGIAEILLDRCPDERDVLEDLFSVVRDSSNVVQRLRSFYGNSPSACDAASVDLAALVERSIELTRPKWSVEGELTPRRISVEANLNPVSTTLANESEVREVFTNLIFNACDAMPEGGVITVTTREVDSFVLAEIRDTGVGMNAETLRRCCEPFYTTKGENGTGLGLGLADSVLKRYGGRLEIVSELNHGTTVSLFLPIEPAELDPGASQDADAAETIGSRPCRVLIVDDDPLVNKLFRRLLEIDGHCVTSAQSGAEALEHMTTESFDVVITDRVMPIMNGDELSRSLKRLDPDLPVIMSTGYANASDESGFPDSIDYMLPKPFDRSSLRNVLSQLSLSR